jgi:hypothetical protein
MSDDDDDVHLYSAHIHAGSMLRAQGIWGERLEKVEKRPVHSPPYKKNFKTITTMYTPSGHHVH